MWWRPNEYSSYQRVWVCAEPFTVTLGYNAKIGFYSKRFDVNYYYYEQQPIDKKITGIALGQEDTSTATIQATRTWNSANWTVEMNPNMIVTGIDSQNSPIELEEREEYQDNDGDWQYDYVTKYIDPIKPTKGPYENYFNFNLMFHNGWNGSFRADNLDDDYFIPIISKSIPSLSYKEGRNVIRNVSFRYKAVIDGIGYHSDWLLTWPDTYDRFYTFTMYPELD